MKEKIERLREILKERLDNHQTMRIKLEGAGDSRNAISYMEKELEVVVILGLFSDVFPECSGG